VPAFGIFGVLVAGFAACAAISVRDIQPTSTLRRKHPLYLMENRRNAGNVFFRRRFPPDLPVCAVVPQGIVGRGRYATINCVFRQGLKHLQAVAAIDFVRFYPHADTSPGLVVMTRYSSVSCGKRSIKGKI